MKNHGFQALRLTRSLVPAFVALLVGQSAAAAHDAGDYERGFPINRYSVTQAFLRGGDPVRSAYEIEKAPIPGADPRAVELGRDLDGDGDPDEITINLEVAEIQEEVYPGEFVRVWVFAPLGAGMSSAARLPSPTLVVEEGDRVTVTLSNTHYFPHTIHFHGPILPNDMDGVPDMTQPPVLPGQTFTYSFTAKNTGTFFYHCHVQDQTHILMGLAGMFVIEPNRPDNHFAHLVVGAGRAPVLSKATAEEYDAEYTLVYMDIDDRVNRIVAAYTDVREVERRMHRDYDVTQRKPNIFLLNGRSFPYTVRDTPILVKPNQRIRLRVLNVGARTIYLHSHGHHPTLTHLDGYPVPPAAQITRDVWQLGPSQRMDLLLRTGEDNYYASGPGVWMLHDHTQPAVTNKGINPGGDHTVIVYDGYMGDGGVPKGMEHHMHELDAAYYRGEKPVFPPGVFMTPPKDYLQLPPRAPDAGGPFQYPVRDTPPADLPRLDIIDAENHRTKAEGCRDRPRTLRKLYLRAGRAYAREGEVFGFEPRMLTAARCEDVELIFENNDPVRHTFMINGLSPPVSVSLNSRGTTIVRFLTPDENVTLTFHCHVPMHDRVGMAGLFRVGAGSPGEQVAQAEVPAPKSYEGVGTVIATVPRMARLIVDHEEIKGFMGAMEMSYSVVPPTLLDGLSPGDRIGFTIDAQAARITGVKVLQKGN